MKRILSIVLLMAMAFTLTIPAFASDVSEETMDAALRDRGYPQIYLDCISLSAKESLFEKTDLTFGGATVTCYDAETGSFVEYDIPASGIMPRGQIPVADLTLTFGISRYATSGNVLVNYSYDWNNIPVFRFQDTLSVSWDPDLFTLVDDSFRRYDKYSLPGYSGLTMTNDPGYAHASPAGVSWYANLCENEMATELYGHGEFLLDPDVTSGTSTVFWGHYVHPTVEVTASVNILEYGSFSVSSGGNPYDERGNQRTYTF